jgi:phospholipid/cholesterol/gamma-HCH transport system substrate-binding protein
MPVLNRRFSERNPLVLGTVGVLAAGLLTVAAFNLGTLTQALTQTTYTAEFAESGNLVAGDEVRLSGVKIGQVSRVVLDNDHVAVRFAVSDDGTLGTETRASVETATVLGTRFLNLMPAGPGRLRSGAVIPLSRTDSPYDLSQILSTLTTKSQELDKGKLQQALNTLTTELAGTPMPLRSALTGVNRLSATIGSRDLELRALLTHAATFTNVLANRSGDIITIVSQGNLLLGELNQRRAAIEDLTVNVTNLINELHGLARDNSQDLGPALDKLNSVLTMLNKNNSAIAASIHGLNIYEGGLGEIANSAPFFMANVKNLVPPTNFVPGVPLGSRGADQTPSSPAPGPVPPADHLPLLGNDAGNRDGAGR